MKRLFFLIALLAAALPLRAQNSASGSITASTTTCAAPGTCVWESPLPFNASTSTINVSGTFSATLLVEESNNAGQTWATAATITTAGTTTYAVNGFTDIRVRCSAYVSGTAVVTINTGLQTGLQGPPGPAGSGGGGINVAGPVYNVCDAQWGGYCDTQNISTASVASSTTVTAPAGTFVSSDVGKNIVVFPTCSTGNVTASEVPILAETTITGFTDSAHVTTGSTATTTAGSACLFWGHPDDTALSAIDTAASLLLSTCPAIQLPGKGYIVWTEKPHWNVAVPGCENNGNGIGGPLAGWGEVITGFGKGASVVFVAPNLKNNLAGCNTGINSETCYGGRQGQRFANFQMTGGGNIASGFGTIHDLFEFGSYSECDHVLLVNFGANDSNALGALTAVGEIVWDNCDDVGFSGGWETGTTGIYEFNQSTFQANDASGLLGFQLTIQNGATVQFNQVTISPGAGTPANGGGIRNSGRFVDINGFFFNESTNSVNAISNQATGIVDLTGTIITNGSSPFNAGLVNATSGAVATFRGTTLLATNGVFGVAGTTTIDAGGNPAYGYGGPGSMYDAPGHSSKGACTGTATSSSTLGLYGTGPNETITTCTSTTIGSGIVVSGAGRTLKNLVVTATHAGVSASSGVVTVMRNGATTVLTCTIGTGTSCIDATHSVALTDGDLISIEFTTQGSEVLAGVSAIVEWTP